MNIKSDKITFTASFLTGLYDSLALFPAALAVGICGGFGVSGAILTALLCSVFGMLTGSAFLPSWLTLLPVFCLNYRFGIAAAGTAVALSGIFVFVLSRFSQKSLLSPEIKIGFLTAAAFCTTALQTTNYFGIGAVGSDAVEIIADYISLGFHGNWRGVLYGTVVLVIMVTYPRKFKSFSKKVPASFVSVVVTLVMNLFLNPDREFTAINEIESASLTTLFDSAFFKGGFDPKSVPLILCTSVAVALIVTEFYGETEKIPTPKALLSSGINTVGGILGAVPVYPVQGQKRTVTESLVCTVSVMLFFFACPSLFKRIPLHSLAVILIVGAWQSIDWSQISKAFKGGTRSVILFILSLLVTVIAGAHYALLMLVLLSVANGIDKDKNA